MAKVEILLSSKRTHLIFTIKCFLDGIEVVGRDKVGILALEDPNRADETLLKAKSFSWKLGNEKDEYGFYLVERTKQH